MDSNINLDSTVSNYAVFGNPIKHSQSPKIHSLFAKQKGITLNYQAIEVPEDRFSDYVHSFANEKGKGINITVPFKEEAFALCHTLSKRAKNSGSVNTISFDEDSNIYGDTTDGKGLINDLTLNHQLKLKNKSILILGAGGSVRAILEPLCELHPDRMVIANRTVSKAEQLAKKFSDLQSIQACSYNELGNDAYDLIINGTSLSLNGQLPAIPKSTINHNTCCYDLMYSKTETIFMKWALEQGAIKVMDGLGMLVEQAAEAFKIWHGVLPDTAPVIKSLR